MLRLVEELGYARRYFDDALIHAVRSRPATAFLAMLEPNAAYFLHEARIDGFPKPFLDHWRERNDPLFVYQYRDPRAVLLSQVNYLRRSHQGREFSNTPYHLMFSDVLLAQPTEQDALSVAIDTMGDYLTESFLGSVWMLHHPRVLTLTYEGLRSESAAADVARLMAHLAITGDAPSIAARLYDPDQRTFHRGAPYGWRDVYTPDQIARFERRYGHLLDIYGYPRQAAT
jgi:hypothetical protein